MKTYGINLNVCMEVSADLHQKLSLSPGSTGQKARLAPKSTVSRVGKCLHEFVCYSRLNGWARIPPN
jgi:hypothetical protein